MCWSLPSSGAGRISVPVPTVYALGRPRTPRDLSVVADDEGGTHSPSST